jgi:hypothetical protein
MSQQDVLQVLEKYPNKWLTAKQITKKILNTQYTSVNNA